MNRKYFIYILANEKNSDLCLGVTADLVKRLWQYKNSRTANALHKQRMDKLVYYEIHNNAESAITREKNLKHWKRSDKLNLIKSKNPDWRDLYTEL